MINLRLLNNKKDAVKKISYTWLSHIQNKMMDFYSNNNRCIIMAPRRCGKSIFLCMQALANKHRNTLLISNNKAMCNTLFQQMIDVSISNNIGYEINDDIISINGYHNKFATYNEVKTKKLQYIFDEIFIDEYQFMPTDLDLLNVSNLILIGERTGPYHFDPNITGIFAGLNIKGED